MILADVDAEIAAYERDYPDDGNESQSHSQSGKRSRAILICSHAAPLIAMGRVLTGDMPEDPTVEDFRVFTAGLSTFVRRRAATDGVPNSTDAGVGNDRGIVAGRKVPDWRRGKGVRGGWDCVANGECGFLSGGAERGWYVSIPSFLNNA
jgi:transcription factor C subunit 7